MEVLSKILGSPVALFIPAIIFIIVAKGGEVGKMIGIGLFFYFGIMIILAGMYQSGSVFGIVVGIIMMVITVVFAVDIIRRIHGGD